MTTNSKVQTAQQAFEQALDKFTTEVNHSVEAVRTQNRRARLWSVVTEPQAEDALNDAFEKLKNSIRQAAR